jgi:hypothetical protein
MKGRAMNSTTGISRARMRRREPMSMKGGRRLGDRSLGVRTLEAVMHFL